jgi:hypothetical protein
MLINMYLQGVFDISPDHGLILVEIADGRNAVLQLTFTVKSSMIKTISKVL